MYRCPLCAFFAKKLTRVVTHIAKVHNSTSKCVVLCGIDGCCKTYKVLESYRRHLYRRHPKHFKSSGSNISGPDDIEGTDPQAFLSDSDGVGACDRETTDHFHEGEAVGQTTSPRDGEPTVLREAGRETFDQFVHEVQKTICMFFFQLAEEYKVPHSTSEKIFGDFQCLLEIVLEKHARQVQQAESACGIDNSRESRRVLSNEFPGCLFEKVKNSYQRERFAIENFRYVKPEEHEPASPGSSPYQYVPIGKVLKSLLQVPDVAEHLLQRTHQLPQQTEEETTEPHVLQSFRNGKAFKQVQATAIHDESVHMLHIMLYTDELGITNPLGPNQKRHKLLVVYFSVIDLHPRYRSELKNIHLAFMAKYKDVEQEGLGRLLQPLLDDLNQLKKEGFEVQRKGRTVTVKVTVVAVCGDNLSLNKLGGFSCCFSSGRVCRFCMALKPKLGDLTKEKLCVVRNAAAHKQYLAAINVNPALRKLYGITGPSPMLELELFDVTKQLMPDVMHDLFEGGIAIVLHHVLKGLLVEGTLVSADFKKVAKFKVGFHDKKNRPENLDPNFARDHRALKGTASQKWCLFRLLPLMFGSSIPEGNVHWEVYLKYREIVDMVLAAEIPSEFLPYLEDQIQYFLRAYHDLYPSASVTAKLHYMVHYPRIISEFGPLLQYWCMRFEAKHQYFKSMASKVKNFKNICKTLSTRHQLLQSHQQQTYVLDKRVSALGSKQVDVSTLNPCAQDLTTQGQLWEATSIGTCTGDYRKGAVLVMDKTTSLSFAQVTTIYLVGGEPVLLLEVLQVERFRRHKHCYKVQRTGDFCLKKPGEEVCSQRLDLYSGGELVPKWDLFYYP